MASAKAVSGIPVVRPICKDHLVTHEDLQKFKVDLLSAIKTLIASNSPKPKRWLKTYEVRELLGVSKGTLQTLRNNGSIPFSKIGGTMYYDADEIDKLVARQKQQNQYYSTKLK